MVNLIGEKFYHPYLKTEITVFDFDRGMLKAKIGSSEFTEWLTVNQGLEFYAEQQKQRADEAEKRADVYLQDLIEHKDALERTTEAYLACCNTVVKEKHRAEAAEGRWEELKSHFEKEKENAFGILTWSRSNGALELMDKLERGEE